MPNPDAQNASMPKLIAELWLRHRSQVLERIAVLDQAASASVSGALTPQLRTEASQIAHKLAGSLGMFGFAEGTRLARQLEQEWEAARPIPARLACLTSDLAQAVFPEKIAPAASAAPPNCASLMA